MYSFHQSLKGVSDTGHLASQDFPSFLFLSELVGDISPFGGFQVVRMV